MELVPNTFLSYKLSPEEEAAGRTLTLNNIAVLHNERSRIAEQKISLKFNPSEPLQFAQQEAYLSGQVELITYLLEMHHVATNPDTQLSGE